MMAAAWLRAGTPPVPVTAANDGYRPSFSTGCTGSQHAVTRAQAVEKVRTLRRGWVSQCRNCGGAWHVLFDEERSAEFGHERYRRLRDVPCVEPIED